MRGNGMTDFISWVEFRGELFYLTDAEVFSPVIRVRLSGSKDNDFLGHGAICHFFDLGNQGKDRQHTYFWDKYYLPDELKDAITSFDCHWGRMFKQGIFQTDDLYFIVYNGPLEWKIKAANQIYRQNRTLYNHSIIKKYIPENSLIYLIDK
jgi:hypothetical protein